METLQQLLVRTIHEGVPLYNEGKKEACFNLYFDAAKYACMQEKLAKSTIGMLLEAAADEAMPLGDAGKFNEGAWVLRHCFDKILEQSPSEQEHRSSYSVRTSTTKNGAEDDDSGYWQDEAVQSTTEEEIAQSMADIFSILQSSLHLGSNSRFNKTYEDCIGAAEIVNSMISLGLASNRKMAVEKVQPLYAAGMLRSVSHTEESALKDGTHLYRYATESEMKQRLEKLKKSSLRDLTPQVTYILALTTVLETTAAATTSSAPARRTSTLHPLGHAEMTAEYVEGAELAALAARVESNVEIKDRKYNLKMYPGCFVGSEAVSFVALSMAGDRAKAKAQLKGLLTTGLVYHVTREHGFEDKKLFYRFTKPKEIQTDIESSFEAGAAPASGPELTRHTALTQRFKQFAGLYITEILDSFYGCTGGKSGPECWDVVDLSVWRNNMKRWGFGRRTDQDDAMVDKLSPLLAGIDPDTWEAPSEEWFSPWGILAQIAIFDQVSRSAFRGTYDAFKWDKLAIKATKVAIERGYFEKEYKSTLNQFVVLLPLEHSESWEDQKLGVSSLLSLLSKVAILDDGLSDYEIVKRLEFSKRLSTAFLEHAQVIAKFKRYPHRNKAHGRTTSLEERIWLASDLVPRWAKSQQHAETKDGSTTNTRNVLQLPVIPLKRLTRR